MYRDLLYVSRNNNISNEMLILPSVFLVSSWTGNANQTYTFFVKMQIFHKVAILIIGFFSSVFSWKTLWLYVIAFIRKN